MIILCKCGCGNFTSGLRKYRNGKRYYTEYCHGHHKGRLGISRPAWNKGLTKDECDTLSRMGYQPGHLPYNNWDKINDRIKNDQEFKAKWRLAKKGQIAWNKGLTKDKYPNGIASGKQHGNWKGNERGKINLSLYAETRKKVYQRDNYKCQQCNSNKRTKLHMHHIIPLFQDPSLAFDMDNLITLCPDCHIKTHRLINSNKSSGN